MLSLATFVSPASTCSYLPDRKSKLHYEIVADLTLAEYEEKLLTGWRRFGHAIFHPVCTGCDECQSLRVDVERFRLERDPEARS